MSKPTNPSYNTRILSKELQKIAEDELNENPGHIDENLRDLKSWIRKQPHLTAREDDNSLLAFLRSCKFSLQRAKEKLDYFYRVKTNWSEYFNDRNPLSEDIQRVLDVGALLPLPKCLGAAGPRIVLIRWGACNPSTTQFQVIVKVMYMVIDILLQEDDNTIVSGIHFIGDFDKISPSYALHLTPKVLYRSTIILQSAYPVRTKGIECINLPTVFDSLFAIFKSVMSQKMNDRTRSYTKGTLSDAYKYIPQSYFPSDYGGDADSAKVLTERWKKKVESYAKWFEDDEKYRSDESLRPEVQNDNMFGVDGTFRNLKID